MLCWSRHEPIRPGLAQTGHAMLAHRAARTLARLHHALRGCRGQGEAEYRAATGVGLDPEPSTMRLDDGATDGQAHAHATWLGGHKGLEQAAGDLRRKARTGVGDRNVNL